MAASSGRGVGVVAIILGLAAGALGLVYELSKHTRRAMVLFIGAGILVILGIIFLAMRKRPAT